MKEIRIQITDEEYKVLKEIAEKLSEELSEELEAKYAVKPNRIVQQFISDLTESENNGGSDERHLAYAWFSRTHFNF